MSVFTVANPSAEAAALFVKHKPVLDRALAAMHERAFFAQYPEAPNDPAYSPDGEKTARETFDAQIGKPFTGLLQSSDTTLVSDEHSPFTREDLKISYPAFKSADSAVAAAKSAFETWKRTSPASRAAVLVEALDAIKNVFFDVAVATQHTTGQAYMMAFQAAGPHANDRALEAVAMGYHEQTRYPESVKWEKPMGKVTAVLTKHFKVAPRGVAIAVGCSTFPVWNSLPGIFASLVTGNTVVVKPHPLGILPLAVAIRAIQSTLKAAGFDPNAVVLAPDSVAAPITKALCENKDVKIIDFTGGNLFGDYVEALPGKITFTEKAGVNCVILDSTADLKAVLSNLATSVSLYSGQMCTAPQNFFVPKGGIKNGDGTATYDEVALGLADAIKGLTTHPKAGPAICGAVQAQATFDRANSASSIVTGGKGRVLLASDSILNPDFPKARTATPALLEVPATAPEIFTRELFGPVALVIPTDDTAHSLSLAQEMAIKHGAISCAAYTTDPATMTRIADAMSDAHTLVSFNLTGGVFVNQNAGFSDFHVSGGNPAGNASFTDASFVVKRFTVVGAKING